MLMWHRQLWLIDHGAALYFHHGWGADDRSQDPFPLIRDHILLRFAAALPEADAALAARLTPARDSRHRRAGTGRLARRGPQFRFAARPRAAYVRHLTRRLEAPRPFMTEVLRARSQLL